MEEKSGVGRKSWAQNIRSAMRYRESEGEREIYRGAEGGRGQQE